MVVDQAYRSLKKFWRLELVASALYVFLARRSKKEKNKEILEISKMEQGHANVWNNIARSVYGSDFKKNWFVKLRIQFMKIISVFFPKTIFIHYMELGERNAIIQYAKLMESFSEDSRVQRMIENIIRDEVKHEWHMMESIADKGPYIIRAKEALHGLLAGILETIAVVIGFVAAELDILFIGLATLIASVTGLITILTINYLSHKSHYDIHRGEVASLDAKHEIEPKALKTDLVILLEITGIQQKTAEAIVEIIGDDMVILKNMIRSLKQLEQDHLTPKQAVITVGTFFLIGTIPTVIPFFIYAFTGNENILHPTLIAGSLAIIIILIAGVFTGVLSNKSPRKEILKYLALVVITSGITYLIGFLANYFLGTGAAH
ncbi:MAG: hypothetical protein HeimAB125_12550 [Candidatus Heimdallarchaeota archaeon AB_125]|nr:MAG: hypothetical protein HeimAB125_12550 [Candidatus Heimdallarchaeota archaeon AB_125]